MKNSFTTCSKDTLSHYKIIKEEKLNSYQGIGILYKHKETGMEIFHLKNDDHELFASYCFKTLPFNNTGVFHILEHTVLTGSKKVPVKDPFSQISQASVNTYLNAYTMPYCTCFPFATILKKDFDNIFYVYTDSIFNPLLRKISFESEGIRQVGTKKNGHMAGVVFNEMQGDNSGQVDVVSALSTKLLFRGTCFENNSGGEVTEIPKLTYEEFLNTYKKWYNPSNCRLFIYGDIDINPYLSYLDKEYLTGIEPVEIEQPKEKCLINKPESYEMPGPKARKSNVSLNWAVADSCDPENVLILNILVDLLLGNAGSPLYRVITESDLGEDLSSESGMTASFRQMVFSVGFSGADRENSKKIEDFLIEELKKIVKKGIDKEAIKISLKNIEFNFQENARSTQPIGYEASKRLFRTWLFTDDPFKALHRKTVFKQLKNKIQDNDHFFEEWIQKYLIDNNKRVLLTVYPDKNFSKVQADKIKALLKEQDQKISDEREQQVNAFNLLPEDPKALKTVPYLKREDIPLRLHPYPHEKQELNGRPFTLQKLPSNGILYFTIGLNTVDLTKEEHMLIPFLTTLLQMTGVDDLDYTEVALRLNFLTGASSFSYLSGRKITEDKPYSIVNLYAKTLAQDAETALAFISNLFRNGDLKNEGRVKSALTDLISNYDSDFTQNVIFYAATRSTCGFSPYKNQKEIGSGLTQGNYLMKLSKLETNEISNKLEKLRDKLVDRSRITVQLTTEESLIEKGEKALKIFIDSFPQKQSKIEINKHFYVKREVKIKDEAYYFDSPLVSYNTLSVPLNIKDLRIKQALTTLAYILSNGILWDKVRSVGGAYAAGASLDSQESLFTFYSYRDPNITKTREIFRSVLETIQKSGFDSKQLERNIISMVGLELRPKSVEAESMTVWVLELYGYTQAYRNELFKNLLEVNENNIKAAATLILENFDKGKFVSIAKKELLKNNNITKPYREIVF